MAIQEPGVWGIDMGLCALKAIRLENINGEVTATAFDYIEHPKILSQPDADPDELTREALQQFLSRNTIKGDMVVISVAGQSGLARFVKLPPVEEKKIADIVKFEAKQQIPFPLEEVVWDFQKIGHGVVTDGFAMETEIGLFAMKKDMVHRSLQQFKEVHVEIHVIQMAPLALCNYVAYDLLKKDGMGGGEGSAEAADKKECVVALDIGTDNSNLIITDGEKIIWQRPIPLGGNHFTRALTKDMKLTFAKAEHLKRNAVKSPELKKILASLKTVLNDFVGEVQRSLGYFTNTHRDATIQYMIGLGNAFRLPGLQKYLQEKLQLEVRKLGKLERVTGEEVTAAPTFTENVMSFAVAYGLALQGLKLSRIQTNLLPYEIRVERIVRGKKPWAVAAAACLLLALGGLTTGYSVEKKGVANEEIDKQSKQAKTVLAKVNQLKAQYDEELAKKKASELAVEKIGAGVKERFNWQHLFEYINMSLPRSNGDRLVDVTSYTSRGKEVRKAYFNEDAVKAFNKMEERRFKQPGERPNPADEEFIKNNLIQISLEGINSLWTEDFQQYWKNIYYMNERLVGMTQTEQSLVRDFVKGSQAQSDAAKPLLPSKGWIVEIRGYTYNKGADDFVLDTILENLANPEGLGDKLDKEMKEMIATVKGQISYLMLLKKDQVQNPPDPTKFRSISKSYLKTLLREPTAEKDDPKRTVKRETGAQPGDNQLDRNIWQPIGDMAKTAIEDWGLNVRKQEILQPLEVVVVPKEGEVAARVTRTEFVIVFIWSEPLPAGSTPPRPTPPVAANPPGTPVDPEPKKN
jgi:type IV pilus assembly protein PilM